MIHKIQELIDTSSKNIASLKANENLHHDIKKAAQACIDALGRGNFFLWPEEVLLIVSILRQNNQIENERAAFPAIALIADNSALTALGMIMVLTIFSRGN